MVLPFVSDVPNVRAGTALVEVFFTLAILWPVQCAVPKVAPEYSSLNSSILFYTPLFLGNVFGKTEEKERHFHV